MLAFFREQDLVLDGQIVRQGEWPAHPANPFPEADRALPPWTYGRVLAARHNPLTHPDQWLHSDQAHHDISMRSWMGRLGLGSQAVTLGYDLNASYGRDAGDISALMLFARAAFSVAQRKGLPAGIVGYTARNGGAAHTRSPGGRAGQRGAPGQGGGRHRRRRAARPRFAARTARSTGEPRGLLAAVRRPAACRLPATARRPPGTGRRRAAVAADEPALLRLQVRLLDSGRIQSKPVHRRCRRHGGGIPARRESCRSDRPDRLGHGPQGGTTRRPARRPCRRPGDRRNRSRATGGRAASWSTWAGNAGAPPRSAEAAGPTSDPVRSPASARRWAHLADAFTSAANTWRGSPGAWRAPWSPGSGRPTRSWCEPESTSLQGTASLGRLDCRPCLACRAAGA